jgi:hypothetical protein
MPFHDFERHKGICILCNNSATKQSSDSEMISYFIKASADLEPGTKLQLNGAGRLWDLQVFSFTTSSNNTHENNPGVNALLSGGRVPRGRTILKTCKMEDTAINRPFSAITRQGHALLSQISRESYYKSSSPSSETKGSCWVLHVRGM